MFRLMFLTSFACMSSDYVVPPCGFVSVSKYYRGVFLQAMHARAACMTGSNLEVMGIIQGKLEENTFVVLDAFALPVEGTETRVTALEEGYEYMVGYQTTCEASGRVEPVIGWYHSHPGGCPTCVCREQSVSIG
jgi:hypothetical protein